MVLIRPTLRYKNVVLLFFFVFLVILGLFPTGVVIARAVGRMKPIAQCE